MSTELDIYFGGNMMRAEAFERKERRQIDGVDKDPYGTGRACNYTLHDGTVIGEDNWPVWEDIRERFNVLLATIQKHHVFRHDQMPLFGWTYMTPKDRTAMRIWNYQMRQAAIEKLDADLIRYLG